MAVDATATLLQAFSIAPQYLYTGDRVTLYVYQNCGANLNVTASYIHLIKLKA